MWLASKAMIGLFTLTIVSLLLLIFSVERWLIAIPIVLACVCGGIIWLEWHNDY